MEDEELLYRIALTFVEGVGNVTARKLLILVPSVRELFTNISEIIKKCSGVSAAVVHSFQSSEPLKRAEKELEFVQKNKIKCLFFSDEIYPSRLRNIDDAPMMLYYMGEKAYQPLRVVSIVGTRNPTDYGISMTERLVSDLASYRKDIAIVSGLAYGIDVTAHRSALKNGLSTYGILAHGLDRIYPPKHRNTAKEMLREGGLISEFPSKVEPERYNFIARNRIIAGLADVVVVVESAQKGGALITANIANSYNIEVATFSGRATDERSLGCNKLIKQHKASLIEGAEDLLELMNWDFSQKDVQKVSQPSLFSSLSVEEKALIQQFNGCETCSAEELSVKTNQPIAQALSLLTELEFKGIVRSLPGNQYRLN